jgi:hypothetical protein
MAAQGTIMYYDPAIVTQGQVRGWKIGFGYTDKGTVCLVYRMLAGGAMETLATEIPLLGNGKADTNAVVSWLSQYGVSLPNAAKTLVGA